MPIVTSLRPQDLHRQDVFAHFERIVLAQGDSWFSIGAIPPTSTSSLILRMNLTRETGVMNCASPGAELVNMVETINYDSFGGQLVGNRATQYNAIFLSAGGNDLINAIQAPPTVAGKAVPLKYRLLRSPAERGPDPQPSPDRYVSEAGWKTFSEHLSHHFFDLVERRESGPNKGVPLFFHTYDYLTPRDSPALTGLAGPWLIRAMNTFEIPQADRAALSREMIDRLAKLLARIIDDINAEHGADMALHLVDTRGQLTPADPVETGATPDWVNEIHPTNAGYDKLTAVWTGVVDPILG